jgi:Flp pilus assembly protein TadG
VLASKKNADTFGRRLRRLWRGEAGTQLAELAIVLPVLLVLFGATAEFGRFFYTYATLAKATRAAARYLTVSNKSTDAGAQNLVIYGNAEGTGDPLLPGLGTTNVDIEREGPTLSPQKVTVGVSGYKYQPIFDLGKLMGNSFKMSVDVKPSTTMRYMNN